MVPVSSETTSLQSATNKVVLPTHTGLNEDTLQIMVRYFKRRNQNLNKDQIRDWFSQHIGREDTVFLTIKECKRHALGKPFNNEIALLLDKYPIGNEDGLMEKLHP